MVIGCTWSSTGRRIETEWRLRETGQGEEVCQASEKARMLIGKAELPQLKKGMPLKPTKLRVESAHW